MISLHAPHNSLGLQKDKKGQLIRLWRPGAQNIFLEVLGKVVEAQQESPDIFIFPLDRKISPSDYRIYHQCGFLAHDPYSFPSTLGEIDRFLFNKGCHYELYSILGAHRKEITGIWGVEFAVWAPNATVVYLVADFNNWDDRSHPMSSLGVSGIWSLFIPDINVGEKYKFTIHTQDGSITRKSDPFAFYSELRSSTASVVVDLDYDWKSSRIATTQNHSRPMIVYEVHLSSWRNYGSLFPNYRQLAQDLCLYCLDMGFTHVELLPIMEHPLDESWGYQVTGFFSVTSRYGTPSDFQFFVDHLHQHGIGVILDWVPAHFPTDEHALSKFDGTCLYEHADPRRGMHPHWNTAIFNYERKEVSNFLIANALFWFDKMRVDGLRVDAVSSMLYLDYGRNAGEWIPNEDGSRYNMAAVELLKHLNSVVHEKFPGALMIAEESSSYEKVTAPTQEGGLGFDLKWNMGWMNDTLRYFSRDPLFRKFHQNELTFSLLYTFTDRFISVLSHDEVVHGKKSLLSKMTGPEWQQFANVRLLYSYMICHPGKKLLFMGNEIGQVDEWNSMGSVSWDLLKFPLHQGLQRMVKEINHFYLNQKDLWTFDFEWKGYEWIDFSDADHSIVSYLRKGENSQLVCIHNFTPEFYGDYWIPLKNVKKAVQVFNTDAEIYGGSNQSNGSILCTPDAFHIVLAPLATMIFEVEFESH